METTYQTGDVVQYIDQSVSPLNIRLWQITHISDGFVYMDSIGPAQWTAECASPEDITLVAR